MPIKPITVARLEYMQQIANVTNASELPSFVKVDILNQVLDKLRTLANEEYKRDYEQYTKELEAEKNDNLRNEAMNHAKQIDGTATPFSGEVNMGG